MKNEGKLYQGWLVVIGCLLITMTMVPPIMALSNKYLIYVTEDLGISRSAFTFANTILQGLGIFISPFVSRKLMQGNMKKIMAVSVIGYAVFYGSYSLATSALHLYISSVLLGICYLNATLIPVSMMVTNWFAKKRGLAISIAMAGIGIGGTIFSPVLSYLLESVGWRNTYRIMALIILVIALPATLFLLKKRPEDVGLKAYGSEDVDNGGGRKAVAKAINIPVSEAKTKAFFVLLLLGMLLNGIINAGTLGQFPPAIQEIHGVAIQATIISLYSIIGTVGKILLGWINDRFGITGSSIFGCSAFALALVFMLLSNSHVSFLYLMAFAFGFGNPIGAVSPPLVVAEVVGTEKYGEAYGIANSFMQTGLSVGSLLVAAIYDARGNYTLAWIVLLVCTVLTLVCWLGSAKLAKNYK